MTFQQDIYMNRAGIIYHNREQNIPVVAESFWSVLPTQLQLSQPSMPKLLVRDILKCTPNPTPTVSVIHAQAVGESFWSVLPTQLQLFQSSMPKLLVSHFEASSQPNPNIAIQYCHMLLLRDILKCPPNPTPTVSVIHPQAVGESFWSVLPTQLQLSEPSIRPPTPPPPCHLPCCSWVLLWSVLPTQLQLSESSNPMLLLRINYFYIFWEMTWFYL